MKRLRLVLIAGLLVVAAVGALGCGPAVDEEFPPGSPTVSAGSDEGGGQLPQGDADDTNFGLLFLLGLCLIGAGVLLVKVERWERQRSESAQQGDS